MKQLQTYITQTKNHNHHLPRTKLESPKKLDSSLLGFSPVALGQTNNKSPLYSAKLQ